MDLDANEAPEPPDTFIVTADGKCGGRTTRLEAGTHTLWLEVGHQQRLAGHLAAVRARFGL